MVRTVRQILTWLSNLEIKRKTVKVTGNENVEIVLHAHPCEM